MKAALNIAYLACMLSGAGGAVWLAFRTQSAVVVSEKLADRAAGAIFLLAAAAFLLHICLLVGANSLPATRP